MGLYTVGSIAWGIAVAFYAAAFPGLARNREHIRELKEQRDRGEITANEYIQVEALEKSRISSFSIVRNLTFSFSAADDPLSSGSWCHRLRYDTVARTAYAFYPSGQP